MYQVYTKKIIFIGMMSLGILIGMMDFAHCMMLMPKPTEYIEGIHYKELPLNITTSKEAQKLAEQSHKKIQVIEFFGYGCYFCKELQPYLNTWHKTMPDNVAFYRFPVVFHQGWDVLAKAFYTLEVLNKLNDIDLDFFEALHKKNMNLSDVNVLKQFMLSHGISEKEFMDTYNSFEVNRRYTFGQELVKTFRVMRTPIILVHSDNKTYFSEAPLVGSEEALIELLPLLIKKAAS